MRLKLYTPLLAALLTSLAVGASAHAAEIRIHVLDARKSVPLDGAAVCLGTPANPSQFGALRTDGGGNARFEDVPGTPLMLTVSHDQYRGYREQHPTKRFNVVIAVKLNTGGLGPSCAAPEIEVAGENQHLAITGFSINGGSGTTQRRDVRLTASVKGNPTHYRVSETPDFSDTDWVAYKLPGNFRLSARSGQKTVYFQVRRFRDAGGVSLQSVSAITYGRVALK